MAGPPIPTLTDIVRIFNSHPYVSAAHACVDALTPGQVDLLTRTAAWQAITLRASADNSEAVDLLASAMERALEHWSEYNWVRGDPKFFKYLLGAIRSIASNLRRRMWIRDEEGVELSINPGPEIQASLILEKARSWLRHGHSSSLDIFDGLRIGLSHEEIRRHLRMTPAAFAAAYAEMRRTVRREASRRHTSAGEDE
jgi:hypothetical protein